NESPVGASVHVPTSEPDWSGSASVPVAPLLVCTVATALLRETRAGASSRKTVYHTTAADTAPTPITARMAAPMSVRVRVSIEMVPSTAWCAVPHLVITPYLMAIRRVVGRQAVLAHRPDAVRASGRHPTGVVARASERGLPARGPRAQRCGTGHTSRTHL